jgi:hypothetical protein
MTEGAGRDINPQAESTLDKMAKGISEDTGAQGAIQGSIQEGDLHQAIEGKMNDQIGGMTEDTGAGGDIHLHTERKMNEMAKKMFEED